MWFAVRGRWRQMILLFLIVRRTPTIRELIVATPLSLSSPSATGLSAHAPAQRLERSDFVLRPKARFPVRSRYEGMGGLFCCCPPRPAIDCRIRPGPNWRCGRKAVVPGTCRNSSQRRHCPTKRQFPLLRPLKLSTPMPKFFLLARAASARTGFRKCSPNEPWQPSELDDRRLGDPVEAVPEPRPRDLSGKFGCGISTAKQTNG